MAHARPHEDRLGTGGSTTTEVLTRTGTGIAEWAEPAGGAAGVVIEGPFAIDSDGVPDIGLTLVEGDIILQTLIVTTTEPSAPIDGDEVTVELNRTAGGSKAIDHFDLFNMGYTGNLGDTAFGHQRVAEWLSTPDLAYLNYPLPAVIGTDEITVGVQVTIDSADGAWDLYVVMQHA